MPDSQNARLLQILVEKSYKYNDDPIFKLSSGKMSNYYVDCKTSTMLCEAIPLVGAAVFQLLPVDTELVGGLTMGADPIAFATSYYCAHHQRNVSAFSVRKEAKKHGLEKFIEGPVSAHQKVVILDDVVTTGNSTIEAIEKCQKAELDIIGIVVLIDREEGGIDQIRNKISKIPISSIFTRNQLHQAFQEKHYAVS